MNHQLVCKLDLDECYLVEFLMSTPLPIPVHLYIKTHVISGIKYFGRTITNPHTYSGSGAAWKRLLKTQPSAVITIIHGIYYNEEELAEAAIKFSQENNIVKDPAWANKRPEPGVVMPRSRTVAIVNVNTEERFASYSVAGLHYLADPRNLHRAIKAETQRWQGCFWILEDRLDTVLKDYGSLANYAIYIEEKTAQQMRKGGSSAFRYGNKKNLRPVVCIETNELFTTTGDAGKAKSISRATVYHSAERYANGAKQYIGKSDRLKLHWRWADSVDLSHQRV